MKKKVTRRKFLEDLSKLAAAGTLMSFGFDFKRAGATPDRKIKLALVGTGSRGTSMWGKDLFHPYKDYVELDDNYKGNLLS